MEEIFLLVVSTLHCDSNLVVVVDVDVVVDAVVNLVVVVDVVVGVVAVNLVVGDVVVFDINGSC